MQKETMGQLLPFAQSAQTLRRFAGKHTAQGNDLQAVELLRLSMQRGAADDETALSLAEAYASLQCYTLSNRLLIPRIASPEVGERCLFGAACNMMSLGMTECARDCAVMYLHDYPDGDWAPDAVEIVEACEEPEEKLPDAQERVEKRVQRALNALNEDKPGLAVRLLGRALTVGRRDSGVHSLLAFALLARGDAKGAVSAARQALRLAKGDLRAQCAMAAALYAVGTKNAARSFLDRAASAVRDEDEAMLVCHTACEMDAPEVVVSVLRETENDAPYSDELLHLMACAYYNAGNREEATRRWKLIRRVNPADAVPPAAAGNAQAAGNAPPDGGGGNRQPAGAAGRRRAGRRTGGAFAMGARQRRAGRGQRCRARAAGVSRAARAGAFAGRAGGYFRRRFAQARGSRRALRDGREGAVLRGDRRKNVDRARIADEREEKRRARERVFQRGVQANRRGNGRGKADSSRAVRKIRASARN